MTGFGSATPPLPPFARGGWGVGRRLDADEVLDLGNLGILILAESADGIFAAAHRRLHRVARVERHILGRRVVEDNDGRGIS